MRRIVITGNGTYAKMMCKYVELTEFGRVVAYAVDSECIKEKRLNGIPVLSFEEMKEKFSYDEIALVMGIGYAKMGGIRKKVFEECKAWGYYFENYVHPTAIIAEDVIIGEGNNILEGVIVEVGVTLGNANLFFGGSMVAHEVVIGDYNTFSVKATVAGGAVVRNHCFIGAASVVRDHITLKDYVLLGAAAYGFKDMEPYSVVASAKSVILEGKSSIEFL